MILHLGVILLNIAPKLTASLLFVLVVSSHLPLKVVEVPILDLLLSILDVMYFRHHLVWQDLLVGKLRKLLVTSNVAASVSFVSMIIVVCKMSILAERTFFVSVCYVRVIKSVISLSIVALVTMQIYV